MTLPIHIRQIAEEVLTDKQREAFEYELAGLGLQKTAARLGVTRGAVRDRLHGAHLKLHAAGIRLDEFGRWTLEQEEAA